MQGIIDDIEWGEDVESDLETVLASSSPMSICTNPPPSIPHPLAAPTGEQGLHTPFLLWHRFVFCFVLSFVLKKGEKIK